MNRATLGNWVLKAAREHLFPLYDLEREWKELPSSERYLKRNEHARPCQMSVI